MKLFGGLSEFMGCLTHPFSHRPKPIKSKTGFLMLDADGIASVDYSNPEARKKLAEQFEFFQKIDLKRQEVID